VFPSWLIESICFVPRESEGSNSSDLN